MPFFSTSQLTPTAALPGITRRAVYLDNVMVTFFDFEPGSVVPEHQHPHEQITIVLEGEMEFTLGNEIRLLHAGEGATVRPNVRHKAVMKTQFTRAIDAWHPLREDYK